MNRFLATLTATLVATLAAAGAAGGTAPIVGEPFPLSDPSTVSRWAFVLRPTTARQAPSLSARPVTRLGTLTPEGTQNLVLVLDGYRTDAGELWLRVRLPVLPNNSTGWIKKAALSKLRIVRTHLVVDRSRLRATLYRDGEAVFSSRVGIGQAHWPTPRGSFYIRNRIVGFSSPMYGPLAFGTSARSPTLTDWPGGGFIGIHGTNEPGILPGRVSHGCIRLPNAAILRLNRLMPVGTPVTVA